MRKSENLVCLEAIHRPQFASMFKYSVLHCCNVVYLQHGRGNCRTQNDVTVSPSFCMCTLLLQLISYIAIYYGQ